MSKLLLALIGATGLFFALWFGGTVVNAEPPAPTRPLPQPPRTVVHWQPGQVNVRLPIGQTFYETDVTFTSAITLNNVTIGARTSGPGSLEVTPAGVAGQILPGTSITVHLKATLPDSSRATLPDKIRATLPGNARLTLPDRPRPLNGLVYVAQNGRQLPMPLPVSIAPAPPPPPPPPVTWSTGLISQTVSAGSTYATDVTFTSTVTLTQASVVVLPPPAGRLIQATPDWSGALAPGTLATVHISVTVPSDFRQRAIAGTLQIRDGRAMLPRSLPVRIQVAPAAVTAAVNGRSGRSDR